MSSPIGLGARFGRDRSGARTATLRLPFLTASFEVAPPPEGGHVRLGPMSVPMPGKTAYYLGLGALTVVELIEWPVAIAIAAGTYVAEQASAAQSRGSAEPSRGARGGRTDEDRPRGERMEQVRVSAGIEPATVGLAVPLPRGLLRRFRHDDQSAVPGDGHAHNGHRAQVAG